LRLINTDADGCGRLEMFHAGSWGTVCDAGFDELDARVACRQLGLSDTGRVGYTVVGAGPGAPIWMSGVACEGTERFLEECVPASYTWGVSAGCSHTDDVSVC
ncbi:SRCR-like domain-containing protein, partial [Baffinella frigidus]